MILSRSPSVHCWPAIVNARTTALIAGSFGLLVPSPSVSRTSSFWAAVEAARTVRARDTPSEKSVVPDEFSAAR